MKRFEFFLAPSLALAALSGCATPQWQKPGATAAQLQTVQSQCDAAARLHFPPNVETTVISGGSYTPGASQCGNPNNTDSSQCYTTPEQYQQPTYGQRDINAEARQKDSQACMIKKGWQLG